MLWFIKWLNILSADSRNSSMKWAKYILSHFILRKGDPTQGHKLMNSNRSRTNKRSLRTFSTSLMPAKIMYGISTITVIQKMGSETRLFGFKSWLKLTTCATWTSYFIFLLISHPLIRYLSIFIIYWDLVPPAPTQRVIVRIKWGHGQWVWVTLNTAINNSVSNYFRADYTTVPGFGGSEKLSPVMETVNNNHVTRLKQSG